MTFPLFLLPINAVCFLFADIVHSAEHASIHYARNYLHLVCFRNGYGFSKLFSKQFYKVRRDFYGNLVDLYVTILMVLRVIIDISIKTIT